MVVRRRNGLAQLVAELPHRVAGRHPRAQRVGQRREARGGHAERVEDLLPDVLRVGPAGDACDDLAQQLVPQVRVLRAACWALSAPRSRTRAPGWPSPIPGTWAPPSWCRARLPSGRTRARAVAGW